MTRTIGKFSHVPKAKLGERIRLTFFQTIPVVELSADHIFAVHEIEQNGYIFSDGCGVTGRDISKLVQRAFGFKHLSGAFQVRIGGFNGML